MLAMPVVMSLSEAFTLAMMINKAPIIDEVKWMAHRSAEQSSAVQSSAEQSSAEQCSAEQSSIGQHGTGEGEISVSPVQGRGTKSFSVGEGECSVVQCSVEEGRESRSASMEA
jgi:hypothetical protein